MSIEVLMTFLIWSLIGGAAAFIFLLCVLPAIISICLIASSVKEKLTSKEDNDYE